MVFAKFALNIIDAISASGLCADALDNDRTVGIGILLCLVSVIRMTPMVKE